MKKAFFCLILLVSKVSALLATTWTPAEPVPLGDSSGASISINLAYDQVNETIIATWGNNLITDFVPFYAIFSNETWSTPLPIPLEGSGSDGAFSDVTLVYDPLRQTVMAAWQDFSTFVPYYSIWNGSSWTTPALIDPTELSEVKFNVNLVFYPVTQSIIAVWADFATNDPTYSFWDGFTWTPIETIPRGASAGPIADVYIAYDAAYKTMIATWGDSSNFSPYYSVYNGTTWTAGAQMNKGTSNGVLQDITSVYNPINGTVMATWANKIGKAPYYTVWNGTTWTPAQPISPTGDVNSNISLSYNNLNEIIVATWGDGSTPTYSFFDQSSWSADLPISVGTSNFSNVNQAFDSKKDFVMAIWPGLNTAQPFFSIFQFFSLENFTGSRKKNDFGLTYEIYNVLKWSFLPSNLASGFNIYRNGTKIATVNGSTFSYQDHNRPKNVTTIYSITALIDGVESSPQMITIP